MHSFIASIIAFFSSVNMMQPGFSVQEPVPLLSIGIVADVQYADAKPAGSRFYRSSADRLKEAYATFQKEGVDLVINLGDLIDHGFDSYKPLMEIIDSSGLWTNHIPGNHDYSVEKSLIRKIPALFPNSLGYSSIYREGIVVVFLNGNEISTYASPDTLAVSKNQAYLDSLKASGEINAMDWNGGIGKKQMNFLDNVLRKAAERHEMVIVACHFPVYPQNVHNLLNYREILELVQKYGNVIALFSGHNHAGNYGMKGKTHFVTFKGMVETEGQNSFAIAEIYEDHIRIRGFGREENRILRY